jgi:hypothetical protein
MFLKPTSFQFVSLEYLSSLTNMADDTIMNNRLSIPLCCRDFREAVYSSHIVDYDKFGWKYENRYERLDGWHISDDMGSLTYPKLEFCPWCGRKLPE